MLKKIILVIVALFAAVIGYAATRPDTFRVERTMSVQAPPEKVFALLNDFHSWADWSPWEKLDPAMKKTHSGAASGLGAVYEWDGNDQVGAGRIEITESTPPSRVIMRLDFVKPFEAHNVTEFTLKAEGATTTVTWAMHGPQPFLVKLMGVFCDMDAMIGKDFETGLANLKALAQKPAVSAGE